MDQKIIDLYNEYIHSALPRREFMARLVRLAGGVAAASAVLPLIEPNYAHSRQVDPTDNRLVTGYLSYKSPGGEVRSYYARPRDNNRMPAILVIHENRGLNEHIEDVARRAAVAGYFALAPDGLSAAGGAPQDQEAARDLFAKTDRVRIASDIVAGVPFLATHQQVNGKIGTVGFCYGGGMALRCAVDAAGVGAAVSFYGAALPADDVAKLKAPVMLQYAGTDERINAMIPEFTKALDAQKVPYSVNMYPGTQHGFHNDSSGARYDEAAAKLAWRRTIGFFDSYLKV
ncbi:MAG: dienelactone hydrolase family protein [Steroidobacteraceae bacterium]